LPDALNQISRLLKSGVKEYKAFEFLIEWEEIVAISSKIFIANISSIHDFNNYWDYNFRNIIARMAEAQVGRHISKLTAKEFIEAAFKTFNASFIDILSNNIPTSFSYPNFLKEYNQTGFKIQLNGTEYWINWKKFKTFELYINNSKKGLKSNVQQLNKVPNLGAEISNVEKIATKYSEFNPALNTSLHIDFVTKNPVQPGLTYELEVHHSKKRKHLGDTYFENSFFKKNKAGKFEFSIEDLRKIKFIELEVSPNCDFAQNKWLKNRFISGILFPHKIEQKNKLRPKINDLSLYDSFPLIKFDGEIYKMCFSFKLFKSLDFAISTSRSDKALFRVKNEAMADIISRMASHATRIGLIEFK
jgi:hypothetical protein